MNHTDRLIHYSVRSVFWLGVTFLPGAALGDETLDRQLADAVPRHDAPPPSAPSRWDFDFGDGRALLRNDGTWQVHTDIAHGGFGCGNYRLGVRFGRGSPACLDVVWIGQPIYGISLKHCNNATRPHRSEGFDALLMDTFDDISCAERLIKCTGVCGTRQEGVLEPAPRFGE